VRRLLARRDDDAGYSLIEVLVAMGVMSVLMAMFTGAILQLFRTTGKAEATAVVQSDLRLAFQRFDQQLRYASWVAEPGQVDTAWYVEFASFDGAACYQLRLETGGSAPRDNDHDGPGVLQLLRWAPGAPPAEGTAGQTIASPRGVTSGVAPFDLVPAGEKPDTTSAFEPDFQQMRVRLSARAGTGTADVDTTFTALNTSRNTPSTHTCSEGRPT
jgi:prepilin-type N-terminal cleavage/methylation domain-containing protein